MANITIIGAGGYVFPLRLAGDILSHAALQNCRSEERRVGKEC